MAGAAGIAAVMNALGERRLPFVFGGDGAAFLFDAEAEATVRGALAATAAWTREDLGLDLRTAIVPAAAIHAAGHDIRVARFAPSPDVSYAMFTGGGLGWADDQMKAGHFIVPAGRPGSRPDLSGLSCRWKPVVSRRGTILSLIVRPEADTTADAFARIVTAILAKAADDAWQGSPLGPKGPEFIWPPDGLDLEARATRGGESLMRRKITLWLQTLLALYIFRSGRTMVGLDPAHYVETTRANTDFRKFDDGLRMTIDCSERVAGEIEALLDDAGRRGLVRHGTHRQDEALMTCIVPSHRDNDHLHFLDGAQGGYAAAATQMKQRRPIA